MFIGYQAVFDNGFQDAIRYASEHGFDYVQFDLNVPRFFLDGLSSRVLADIRTSCDDHDVRLSLHAPGDNISLFSDYSAVRRGIIEQFHLILDRANRIGARHLTVHPGCPPSFRKADEEVDSFRREYHEHYVQALRGNLREICSHAGEVAVCVENCGAMPLVMEALPPMFDAACAVFLCWDIAKSQGEPEVEGFYEADVRHLREVHLHDVDTAGRQHRAVGDGRVPFRRYLRFLELADVATTIEVRPREAALRSKGRLLELAAGS